MHTEPPLTYIVRHGQNNYSPIRVSEQQNLAVYDYLDYPALFTVVEDLNTGDAWAVAIPKRHPDYEGVRLPLPYREIVSQLEALGAEPTSITSPDDPE